MTVPLVKVGNINVDYDPTREVKVSVPGEGKYVHRGQAVLSKRTFIYAVVVRHSSM